MTSANPSTLSRPEPGIGRSSRVMAVGTIASRGTGFLRTAVIAAAIGTGLVGDAYNVANTTPNILYDLLLGGVLTSVVVPLLVAAAEQDRDGGQSYAQRLLSFVLLTLGAATVIAVLAAPAIVRVYARGFSGPQVELAVTFTRFFLPQILFYGLGATIGAILNTRNRFAEPMWAPVLNNLVVIAAGLLFLGVAHGRSGAGPLLTTGETLVLSLGTTAGIVVQTVALLPALRASGFRFRLRLDLRGVGLGAAARLAGWVLVYVLATQVGFLVVVNLATAAGRGVHGAAGTGYSPYTYAYTFFQLPHAIVAVSVITALLPRMSRHAVADRLDLLRDDLSTGLRLSAAALIPATAGLAVLAVPVSVLVFAHGHTSPAGAHVVGTVLAAFAVALVPFSAFQLQLRAFYALKDTRTPALVAIALNAVNIGADLALFALLPPRQRVVGLALGFALAYTLGLVVSTVVLRRRLAGVDGPLVVQTVIRLGLAALLGAVPAAAVSTLARHALGDGQPGSLVAVLGGVAVGGTVFVAAALRMHVAEVAAMAQAVRSRRPRRRRTG